MKSSLLHTRHHEPYCHKRASKRKGESTASTGRDLGYRGNWLSFPPWLQDALLCFPFYEGSLFGFLCSPVWIGGGKSGGIFTYKGRLRLYHTLRQRGSYLQVRQQIILIIQAVGHTIEILRLSQHLPLQRGPRMDVHKGGLQVVLAEQGVCVAPDGDRGVKGLQRVR